MTASRGDGQSHPPQGQRSVGRLYTWWRRDPLASLSPVSGLTAGRALNLDVVGLVSGLERGQVEARVREGDVPYLAHVAGRPAAVGWSAHSRGHIGELGMTLELPPGNHYLWDFRTLPERRGLGIYPRLLQAVLDAEAEAERFWIGHSADNVASASGILKAGFGLVGEVWAGADGLRLVASSADERADAAASLLGIPPLFGR